MRKIELIRENVRLKCRVQELQNIVCPGEQHDFNEARSWFEPLDYESPGSGMITCRELVCKRCFTRRTTKQL